MANRHVTMGNHTVAKAALIAGCDFFGGYPITPSSEIAQYMSGQMPLMDRAFIQMEDEISSLGSCIGAALTGRKAMTATSGPGYSLMLEHLGMAAIAEVPLVIVNVMRGGPSTGLPTKPGQADMMQAKWGSHGDYPSITLYPAMPQQIVDETIRAFHLSQKYLTPVTLLLDETIAKAHEDVELPDPENVKVFQEVNESVVNLNMYDREMGERPPRINFFKGFPVHVESLEHEQRGWPTNSVPVIDKMQNLRLQKILMHLDDIIKYETYQLEDAEIMIFSFGISARASMEAVDNLRKEGVKVGLFQALTIWPFPEEALCNYFKKIKKVLTVELNMGQMKYEIERIASDDIQQRSLNKATGVPFKPVEVEKAVKEFV